MGDKDQPPDRAQPTVRPAGASVRPATSAVSAARSVLDGSEADEGRKANIALVLSGGIGLGAYQGGAFAELFEAGGLRPDWIAGSSTGAANAALIAGGAPETSVRRLRRFWDAVAKPAPFPLLPFLNGGHGGMPRTG